MTKGQLNPTTKPSKLPRLPKSSKVHKRPLLHPPIAATRTGASNQKIVYVSSKSPFISIIKRVRAYLAEVERRSLTSAVDIDLMGPSTDREKLDRIAKGGKKDCREEEVLVKATGKAIEKALQVALYFQQQEDCVMRLGTGSVGAVDDVELEDGSEESRVRRASVLEIWVKLKE